MFKPTSLKRKYFFIIFDIILSFLTLILAYNLRFNFAIPQNFLDTFFITFIYLTILKICSINYFKIYKISWRFFGLSDAKKLFYAHIVAYTLFTIIYYIYPENFNPFPRSVLIIDIFLSMVFLGILRISKRLIIEGENDKNLKKTLIIGATNFTQTIIKEKNSFYISSLVDNNDMVVGSYISNIIVQPLNNIEKIVKDEHIESVIIAKEFSTQELKDIHQKLHKLNILDILIANISQNKQTLKSLSVEDLLARHPKDLDKDKISSFIKNKTILITGAGGSIGSEIVSQCKIFGAKELILLDHSEFNLYSIAEKFLDISDQGLEISIHTVMQSVSNYEQLNKTFEKYKPDIVIHAAAYKHVPLVENNIDEAIINNIIGTKNTIDCAIKHNVEKFILISTDKAVRPTNVMGTTKRVCELYLQNVKTNNTEVVAVRFGNVLGSSGSVIPKFKAQIEAGKNITVTHKDITRYFMLISEACELVLQAASIGKNSEIFILDMGEPVKIVDLAKKMIELSKRDDIDIEFTGLRPGEKLYEELLINESDASTQYDSITVAGKTIYNIIKLNKDIDELLTTDNKIEKLKQIVPEFEHKLN